MDCSSVGLERTSDKREVESSNLFSPTIYKVLMNFNDTKFLELYTKLGLQNPKDFHIAQLTRNIEKSAPDFLSGTGRTTNELVWKIYKAITGKTIGEVRSRDQLRDSEMLTGMLDKLGIRYAQQSLCGAALIKVTIYPARMPPAFIYIDSF